MMASAMRAHVVAPISGLPQAVDMGKGSLECVRAVVLNHPQRGVPGIDVVQMEHGR